MLIICPNCTTVYDVESRALGDSGRMVRCRRCLREWFATASAIPPPPGQMPAASPPVAAAAVADPAGNAPAAAVDWRLLPDARGPAAAPGVADPAGAGEDGS
jgi:predicted Zn finger-like uncharacterized protein